MRIAILGTGGVGGYYGGLLARAGHDVRLLARGDNLAAIRDSGLRIRAPDEAFTAAATATDDAASLGEVDAALVAVKSYALESIAASAARLGEAGAAVVPLLNGVDAAERLQRAGVAARHLLGGLTYISALRVEPGVFERRSAFQRVVVGELGGGTSKRAESIADAFREAGVEADAAADIETELWRKLMFLAPLSAACGLARAPVGVVRDAPMGRLLLERAVAETGAVARARGARLEADEERRVTDRIAGLPPDLRPSFLADVLAGGPTELDILSGAIARLGRGAGVATPIHDTAVAALSLPGDPP